MEYQDEGKFCNPVLTRRTSAELMGDLQEIETMTYYALGVAAPQGHDRFVTGVNGELDILRRAMRTGGHKYSKTTNVKKGEEKLALFDEVLASVDELTIIGYGFGDPHVNHRVSNAMVKNDRMRIEIVEPIGARCPEFLDQFDYGNRVAGARCGAAHWMQYVKNRTWDAALSAGLESNRRLRADVRALVEAAVPWSEWP